MAKREDATAAPEQPKSRKRVWLLAAAAAVLLAAGGATGAYLLGMLPGTIAGKPHDGEAHGEAGALQGEGHGGTTPGANAALAPTFVDMPDLIVNLQSDARRMRFLKLRLALEVQGGQPADMVRGLMPRIMDGFQLYLRALTADELNGAAGVQRLKEELVARANLAVEPLRVNDVLLKEMLVQ
jgi:flagellar FliL protein